jgi:transcriptional regulator
MYVPEAFRETSLEVLHGFIAANPLGLLVSMGARGPVVTPVPFVLAPDEGPFGTLRAHVSRANPHWRMLAEAPEALVLFQGPHAYVTPAWYAGKRETGKVVPTWNYVIVEASGQATVIHDADWLRRQISALTDRMERPRAEPWAVDDAPQPFVAAQVRGVVGIELPLAALEGKWKVSQNRPDTDRVRVAEGFAAEGAAAMAAEVAARVGPRR